MGKDIKKNLCLRIAKLIHFLGATALFGLCLSFFYLDNTDGARRVAFTLAGCSAYLVLIVLLGRVYDVYSIGSNRVSRLLYSQELTFLLSACIVYVLLLLGTLKLVNPLPILLLFVAQSVWTVLWSLIANALYFKLSPPRDTVIIYSAGADLSKLNEIDHAKKKFCVKKYVEVTDDTDSLFEEIGSAQIVFLVGLDVDVRNELAKKCIVSNVQCYIMPTVSDVILSGSDFMHTFSVPFIRVKRASPNVEYLIIKRAFDIIVSLVGIIVASPFMLITALAVKLYDGGPVLYKQVRFTKNYKKFNVLKFRSMRTDAEKDGVARLSTANDDRITPIGKLIRKIRFDELPQLFNILKGDMTIVGPRPERPEIAEQYEKEIPSFGLRLQVKAGLTGYAQVYGRYNTEPYDKLKMDLMYINNMSIAMDIKLMFATVKILFLPESTEGIAQGQVTASHKETEQQQKNKEKEIQNV